MLVTSLLLTAAHDTHAVGELVLLGGSPVEIEGYQEVAKIWVPTWHGGTLTISASGDGSGTIFVYYDGDKNKAGTGLTAAKQSNIVGGQYLSYLVAFSYGDGTVMHSIPAGSYGWYYVQVQRSSTSTVTVDALSQSGSASRQPWPYYWWTYTDEGNINLYDDGQALDVYDIASGSCAKKHEKRTAFEKFLGPLEGPGCMVYATTLNEMNAEVTLGWDIDNQDLDGDGLTGIDNLVSDDFWSNTIGRPGSDNLLSSNITGHSWWGHCGFAAAAMIEEYEPTAPTTWQGQTFTPEMKKQLLVALYHWPSFAYLQTVATDTALWHNRMEYQMLMTHSMFMGDLYHADSGPEQIWFYPVYAVTSGYKQYRADDLDWVLVDSHVMAWTGSSPKTYKYLYKVAYYGGWAVYGQIDENGDPCWKEHPDPEPNGKQPDDIMDPHPATSVSDWWMGTLNYQNIRAIVPGP